MNELQKKLSGMSPTKLAYAAQQLESKQKILQAEPIAIVGMSCRLPGNVNSVDDYWDLLSKGIDAISEVPKSRWDNDKYYDPDTSVPGKINTRYGGFVKNVDQFDPMFFGIAPIEAEYLDPQQRLLLELSWEALESANYKPEDLFNSSTGVFVGISSTEYGNLLMKSQEQEDISAYFGTGNATSVASGRLAYVLGLTGPCMSVDTACSSSLVSVHLACQSLREREADMALAAGVNLLLAPETSINFSKANMLANDGHCKTFDEKADGYVRGEGCGVVVLKRLSDAVNNKDKVVAIIRGSSVNQDGPSGGLTVPNGPSQKRMFNHVLKKSGVDPAQISYVEAHGTGTSLGDPIEIESLGDVFKKSHTKESPLCVGSVKTNIGHLEAAAGIAGLIKTCLCLQHEAIAPHLHFKTPSSHIAWDDLPIKIPTELTPWKRGKKRRLAGISSFGFSGTNAHVILEEASLSNDDVNNEQDDRSQHILTLSAKSDTSLKGIAKKYINYLNAQETTASLGDISYTSHIGRSHFNHRLSIVGDSKQQWVDQLEDYLKTTKPDNDQGIVANQAKIAFLYTGQGSQYPDMCKDLFDTEQVFKDSLLNSEDLLKETLEYTLTDVLYGKQQDKLSETQYTQPALFAIEIALTELWKSWGIQADYVMGHSLGEYVAACVQGVMSIEDGLKLVSERGRLMQALPNKGSMLSVLGNEQTITDTVNSIIGLEISAYNAPGNLVISGEQVQLNEAEAALTKAGIKCKALNVAAAFHSSLVEPMLNEFGKALEQINLQPANKGFISNLTGQEVQEELSHKSYWLKHIRKTVNYRKGVNCLVEAGVTTFIEIGPQPVLLGLARQCVDDEQSRWLPSARQNLNSHKVLMDALAGLYFSGATINWAAVDQNYSRKKVKLPTYAFQRERYWFSENTSKKTSVSLYATNKIHPLLGAALKMPKQNEKRFENAINTRLVPYLKDHRVFDRTLFPATGFIELINAAAKQIKKNSLITLEDIKFLEALQLDEKEKSVLHTVVSNDDEVNIKVFSCKFNQQDELDWVMHAQGNVSNEAHIKVLDTNLDSIKAEVNTPLSIDDFYKSFRKNGIEYGECFNVIKEVWANDNNVLGHVELHENLIQQLPEYILHPVLLDGCFQLLAGLSLEEENQSTYLPVAIKSIQYNDSLPKDVWCYVTLNKNLDDAVTDIFADFVMMNSQGDVLVNLLGLKLKKISASHIQKEVNTDIKDWLYESKWKENILTALDSIPTYLGAPASVKSEMTNLQTYLGSKEGVLDVASTQLIEELCCKYIINAFIDLGWAYKQDGLLSLEDVLSKLGISNNHQRLTERLLEVLTEHNYLQKVEHQWQVLIELQKQSVNKSLNNVLGLAPWTSIVTKLLSRCGDGLASVLKGNAEATDLIFPDGNTEDATRLYQDAPAAKAMNKMMQQALLSLLKSLPRHKKVRILEIGAGTGGTTAHLLPYLNPKQTEYCFTDLTTLFTMQAENKFQRYDFIEYELLDIEKSPLEQGFKQGEFDIVIASNVIHATADLNQTIRNINEVLSPNGVLMLLEGIVKQTWLDLIFGLTDGWWKFTDNDLRDYPLISPLEWKQLLGNNQYKATEVIQLNSKNESGLSQQAIIMAQKDISIKSDNDYWLVYDNESELSSVLEEKLKINQEDCIVYKASSKDALEQVTERLSQTDSHCKGVLYLATSSAYDSLDDLKKTSEQYCGHLLKLVQALLTQKDMPQLWIVTQQAQRVEKTDQLEGVVHSQLWGMGKVIAIEHPELKCKRIDIDGSDVVNTTDCLFDELHSECREEQIAYRNGKRNVARLSKYNSLPNTSHDLFNSGSYRLDIIDRGTLDNIYIKPVERRFPEANEVEIHIKAAALNFRDVLNALDMVPGGKTGLLGGECAGDVVSVGENVKHLQVGDRVLGIAPGSFGNYVTIKANMIVKMADCLSYEQAAAIPIAYLTTHYTLNHIGQLKAGEKILIHAATGGVGQVAVQLAQKVGAEIYATASIGKWDVLEKLGVKHKMNSRSLDFADEIIDKTQGEGIDIVLNSLSGDYIEKTVSVIKDQGRFIEIGKRDIWTDEDMAERAPQLQYNLVDLVSICEEDPALIQSMLNELMGWFDTGELSPPQPTEFEFVDYLDAFRYMQQAKHTGKIVLRIPQAQAAIHVKDNSSYLITGGLGGLGRLVTQWLIDKGAGHVALLSRREVDEEAQSFIDDYKGRISVVSCDIANSDQLDKVIQKIEIKHGELKGVIHAAGVLSDGLIQQQDWSKYETVFNPKVWGTWNLHESTKDKTLDFFVLFSSIAALLGSAGQSNHSAANSYMDQFAAWRQAQGFPALSINWGVWSEVGAAASLDVGNQDRMQGMDVISPLKGIQSFDYLLTHCAKSQMAVFPVDLNLFDQAVFDNPFYSDFKRSEQDQQLNLLEELSELAVTERFDALINGITVIVERVLGFKSSDKIDINQGLFDLGMDSLTSMELRNRFQYAFECSLSSTLLFEHPTVRELADFLSEEIIPLEFENNDKSLLQDELKSEETNIQQIESDIDDVTEDVTEDEMADLLAAKLSALQEAEVE